MNTFWPRNTDHIANINLQSSLEFPSGGSPLSTGSSRKPHSIFQPHAPPAQTLCQVAAVRKPHRQEDEEEETETPHKYAHKYTCTDTAHVGRTPRQWLPSYLKTVQLPATSAPDVHILNSTGHNGSRGEDGRVKQSSTERRLTSALKALDVEQRDKAKIIELLRVRDKEINDCHQLLWHSQVAPSQVLPSNSDLPQTTCFGGNPKHQIRVARGGVRARAKLLCATRIAELLVFPSFVRQGCVM